MAKGYTNNKNSKVKRFLFFLGLALIFWVLTKFSREFTSTMKAKINYENIPETAALSENNIHEITFDLTANGFEILFYKFKRPVISVPIAKYYSVDQDSFQISRNELLRLIKSDFSRNLSIKNLSVEKLNVNLDPIILKRVKVIPQTEITFKDGYKPIDSIIVAPDSITISGPSGSLKIIETVNTDLISLKNVESNILENVKISKPSEEIVAIKPNIVQVSLAVAEFSQRRFTLPVEVVNLPPNIDIKLVPEMVTVTFDLSIINFSKVSKEDFRVVCDYADRNKDENFMVPFLEKQPEKIYNLIFDPKKIDFFTYK